MGVGVGDDEMSKRGGCQRKEYEVKNCAKGYAYEDKILWQNGQKKERA